MILELLDRISRLEETAERLGKIIMHLSSGCITQTETMDLETIDKTKHIIDGRTFSKNRLVLKVVKKYATEHSGITFSELRSILYDK